MNEKIKDLIDEALKPLKWATFEDWFTSLDNKSRYSPTSAWEAARK